MFPTLLEVLAATALLYSGYVVIELIGIVM